MDEARKNILLKAAFDFLSEMEERDDWIEILGTTIFYDGTECDGSCLKDDIAAELGLDY